MHGGKAKPYDICVWGIKKTSDLVLLSLNLAELNILKRIILVLLIL